MDELAPIKTNQAWRGAELEASEAWGRRLTEAEIAALIRAADLANHAPCPGFGKWAFEIPELAPLLAWTARQLEYGPGVVRIKGVPVDRMPRDMLRRLFWGFCVNLGRRGVGGGERRNRHWRGVGLQQWRGQADFGANRRAIHGRAAFSYR